MKLGYKDDAIAFLVMANQRMDTLCSVNMQRLMHERSMLANIQRKEALAAARQKEIAEQRRMLFTLGGWPLRSERCWSSLWVCCVVAIG